MSEPTTPTGKALLDDLTYPKGDPLVTAAYARSNILAIEREAAAAAYPDLARKAAAWERLQSVVRQFHMFHEERRGMDWQTCDHFRCHSNRTAIAAALEQGE